MGPPKKSPFGSSSPQPALQQTTTCDIGRRCHVSGKNLKTFGTKFTQTKIKDIASSSVLLVDAPKGNPAMPMASGTLIEESIVLCAAHSVLIVGSNVEVILFFENDAATAPPGRHDQYNMNDPASLAAWRAGTKLRTKAQGKVAKVLEQGDPNDLDFALLAVQWTDFAPDPQVNAIEVPRLPVALPPSRSFAPGDEVVLIGHPIFVSGHPSPQLMSDVEATEATVGKVTQVFGPNSETNQGTSYGYATMASAFGMSGGGVFNESGNIIGVLKGVRAGLGTAFLNIAAAASSIPNSRLKSWLDGNGASRPGDPRQTVTFRVKP